jgi:hypothetical protein
MTQIAFEGRLQDIIIAPGAIYHVILAQVDGGKAGVRVSLHAGETLFPAPRGQRLILQV